MLTPTVSQDAELSAPALLSNELNIAAVHPRNGAKYSKNLYRWLTLRGHKHHAWTSRVYADNDGLLWIGFLDNGDFFGGRLMNVLCLGTKAESACWTNLGVLVEVIDFWPRYERDGRCAIDTAHRLHFVDDATRWSEVGQCLWCGKNQ